jgi:hypothetical protein
VDCLTAGLTFAETGDRLGITAGLAYLIATGVPADGSDTLTAEQRDDSRLMPGSSQHLANPQSAQNPTERPEILEWIRNRARSDSPMQRAAAQRNEQSG